jgi:hypothetical protein
LIVPWLGCTLGIGEALTLLNATLSDPGHNVGCVGGFTTILALACEQSPTSYRPRPCQQEEHRHADDQQRGMACTGKAPLSDAAEWYAWAHENDQNSWSRCRFMPVAALSRPMDSGVSTAYWSLASDYAIEPIFIFTPKTFEN